MVLQNKKFLLPLIEGANGLSYHQVTGQSLEYSNDKFYPYESVSGLPLCILTGEQEFNLKVFNLQVKIKNLFYKDFVFKLIL